MLSSLYSKLLAQTCFQISLNGLEVFQRLKTLFTIPTLNTPFFLFLLTVISPTQSLSQVLDFPISSFFLILLSACIYSSQAILPNKHSTSTSAQTLTHPHFSHQHFLCALLQNSLHWLLISSSIIVRMLHQNGLI